MRKYFSTKARFHGDHIADSVVHFDPGDYLVDISSYTPLSEAVAAMKTRSTSPDPSSWSYDFKDGKDTGMSVPVTRYPGIDPTEVQAVKDALTDSISHDVSRDLSKQIDDAANAAVANTDIPAPSASPVAAS